MLPSREGSGVGCRWLFFSFPIPTARSGATRMCDAHKQRGDCTCGYLPATRFTGSCATLIATCKEPPLGGGVMVAPHETEWNVGWG